MTDHCYAIIANCNFESRDDALGAAINDARRAVEAGLTDDAALVAALDDLEETLTAHADDEREPAVRACDEAEQAVEAAWTADVQEAVQAAREAGYVDY